MNPNGKTVDALTLQCEFVKALSVSQKVFIHFILIVSIHSDQGPVTLR